MSVRNVPNKIILHCSDTPDSGDRYGADDIAKWHTEERGWKNIGYHYVIRRTGVVEIGRSEDEIGAHAQGHNEGSLGICLVGTRRYTNMQYAALVKLIGAIRSRHSIGVDEIYGHYEFNEGKTCPGLDMTLVRNFLMSTLLIVKV